MNTFILPRPSLRGAILWQRRRHAAALTPSAGAVALTFLGMAFGFMSLAYDPLERVWIDHWPWLVAAVVTINVAAMTLVRVGPDGVRSRRLVLTVLPTRPAPLGGEFRRSPAARPGESDHDPDFDEEDEAMTHWVYYQREDTLVSIDCLRPKATAEWLNAQLRRIQEQTVPVARAVDTRRVPGNGG